MLKSEKSENIWCLYFEDLFISLVHDSSKLVKIAILLQVRNVKDTVRIINVKVVTILILSVDPIPITQKAVRKTFARTSMRTWHSISKWNWACFLFKLKNSQKVYM
jgi:hypothetical protein